MERDKDFWFSRGRELFRTKDYEAALEAYKRAIELGEGSSSIYYNVAACFYNLFMGDIKLLRERSLSSSHGDLHDFSLEKALTAINEAILRFSSYDKSYLSDAYLLKARILWWLDKEVDARKARDQALLLNPSNDEARSFLKPSESPVQKPQKEPWENILNVRCYDGAVKSVVYSPDGKYIASVDYEGTVRVWKALSLNRLYSYQYRSGSVNFIGWSPNSKYIILGSSDGTVMVGEALAEKWFQSYKGHTMAVNSAAWSPDGKYIASGGDDTTIHVWEALTGKQVRIYKRHHWAVNSIAWSPDGSKYIASGGDDKNIHVWEALTGKRVLIYKGHSLPVNSVAYSPSGNYIASGSSDETIHIWQAFSGDRLFLCKGHTGKVNSVAWSHDSKYIASAAWDETGIVWDTFTGKRVHTIRLRSEDWVKNYSWSPDSCYLAFGTKDGAIQVYKMNL